MCYILTYSCYCYFLESFYKELAVALSRVVRHGHGENVAVGSNARFEEVPSMRGRSQVRLLSLMDGVQSKPQLAG